MVDGGGSIERAPIGDMIAQLASDNGWGGVVIYGAIRDRVATETIAIGLRALETNPRESTKTGAGEADVVLTFGGVTFRLGARLCRDEDGVLVEL